ncbi:MAG: hypothetical protein OXN18_16330 [Gemmatimonadota bacterium]|nr:hypothetical protein [Gemmatimonadota bacterium]
MFRPSSYKSTEPDRFLPWKVRALVIGAGLAFVGMGFDLGWLIWSGIGVLALGLLLRFLPERDDS